MNVKSKFCCLDLHFEVVAQLGYQSLDPGSPLNDTLIKCSSQLSLIQVSVTAVGLRYWMRIVIILYAIIESATMPYFTHFPILIPKKFAKVLKLI